MDAAGASHYGYVEVLNSAGSSIGSAYNYYSANNILHADGITIPTSGTYHVRVFADRSYYTHTYRLRLDVARGVGLEREDNGSPSSPNQLTFIQAGATRTARVAGALDTTSDYDHFGWGTINAGNSIEITATPLSPSTLERVKLTLVNSAGTAIPDADGDPSDGHVSAIAPADGIYCARVETTSTAGIYARYVLDVSVGDATAPRVASVSGLPAQGGFATLPPSRFEVAFSEDLEASGVKANSPVVSFGGHFYLLTPASTTRAAAEQWAQGVGGHLVSITSQTENDFVFARFGGSDRWIGASDETTEGVWTWPTGEAFSYTNWYSGHPSTNSAYDFAFLRTDGTWYSYPDSGSRYGVVEIDGADTDADGVPDTLDAWPDDAQNAFDLRECGPDTLFDTATTRSTPSR